MLLEQTGCASCFALVGILTLPIKHIFFQIGNFDRKKITGAGFKILSLNRFCFEPGPSIGEIQIITEKSTEQFEYQTNFESKRLLN